MPQRQCVRDWWWRYLASSLPLHEGFEFTLQRARMSGSSKGLAESGLEVLGARSMPSHGMTNSLSAPKWLLDAVHRRYRRAVLLAASCACCPLHIGRWESRSITAAWFDIVSPASLMGPPVRQCDGTGSGVSVSALG